MILIRVLLGHCSCRCNAVLLQQGRRQTITTVRGKNPGFCICKTDAQKHQSSRREICSDGLYNYNERSFPKYSKSLRLQISRLHTVLILSNPAGLWLHSAQTLLGKCGGRKEMLIKPQRSPAYIYETFFFTLGFQLVISCGWCSFPTSGCNRRIQIVSGGEDTLPYSSKILWFRLINKACFYS